MNRRDLVLGIGLAACEGLITGCTPGAWQQRYPAYGYPYIDYWSEESVAARRNHIGIFGRDPALERDIERAGQILSAAPKTSPLAVLNHFADLSEVGSTNEPFNQRWRRYENPVIVAFFHETGTKPDGDCTPWCAACLCWCLERVGIESPRSAKARSFRKFANETTSPSVGDIVVFQNVDNADLGHVALYLDETDDSVYVLGGNQGSSGVQVPNCPPDRPYTRIGREWRKKADNHQRVISYRRYG